MPERIVNNCDNLRILSSENYSNAFHCVMHPAGETLNGVTYNAEVLRSSLPMWNNVKCFFDHSEKERSVRDIAGYFENVKWDENEQAICGDLKLLQHADCEKIKSSIKEMLDKKIKLFGLSSVNYVELDNSAYQKGQMVVNQIVEVESVDLVTSPATDARFTSYNSIQKKVTNMPEEKSPEITVDVNAINAATLKMNEAANQMTVMTVMNSYNLNDKIKALVTKEYSGINDRLLTKEEVTAKVEVFNGLADELKKEYVKEYDIPAPAAEVGSESQDKMADAIDGFFQEKDVNGTPRYESIREIYTDLTGDKSLKIGNLVRSSRNAKFKLFKDQNSLMSDDLAVTLGNFMNRALMNEYDLAKLQFGNWEQIAEIIAVKDFRPQYRMRFGGYGDLPKVAQGDNYEGVSEVTEETSSYYIEKRGGIEDITLETIASAALFADRSATYGSTAINFTNTATMTIETLKAGRLAMLKYPERDSGQRLGIYPRYLCCPPDLVDLALGILKSTYYPRITGTANTENFQPAMPNYAQNSAWNIDVIPYTLSTSSTKWFLMADKADVPTIEVGFYGSKEPTLVVQDRPDVGSVFNADKITYKVYHIYGAGIKDWRGVYGYGF